MWHVHTYRGRTAQEKKVRSSPVDSHIRSMCVACSHRKWFFPRLSLAKAASTTFVEHIEVYTGFEVTYCHDLASSDVGPITSSNSNQNCLFMCLFARLSGRYTVTLPKSHKNSATPSEDVPPLSCGIQ